MTTSATILPFLIAFMAGLCVMREHDIYAVNAWNVGTQKLEPWRARTNGLRRVLSSALSRASAFMDRLWLAKPAWLPMVAAIVLMCMTARLEASYAVHHVGSGVSMAVIVLGTPAEMRERRKKLTNDMGILVGPNSTFENADKRRQFDEMMADYAAYGVALEDSDRAASLQRLTDAALPESQRQQPREGAEPKVYEKALGLYLRGVALGDMAPEERASLQHGFQSFSAEQRDMATYSGANGGFLVPPDSRFYGVIIQAMKYFGGMEAVGSEVIETDTAGPMPMPMGDDTGNVGTIIPEAKVTAHAGGTSPVLTELVLNGYLYSSKVVKVSWQMLRDPKVNVEGYVGGLLGQRLARIQNTHFTTGIGGSQPYGIMAQASVGRQSAVGNTTSVPFDDIYKLVHAIDVAYRTSKCKWMMADTSALVLRLAKDGVGRYLWPEMNVAGQEGQPSRLTGYDVVINNDVAAMAASAKWASFGDHSYYKIRRVGAITIVRINELYVESGQVGFLAFQSADGGFADAGQHPVKLLQNSAT